MATITGWDLRGRAAVFTRAFALIAGVYLTGLPTYYAVVEVGLVGGPARDARHVGLLLFIAWVVVALAAGALALSDNRRLFRLLYPRQYLLINDRQRTTGRKLIDLLVADRGSLLHAWGPKIYVVDSVEEPTELVPLFDPEAPQLDRWPLGEGIIGRAFKDNNPEVPIRAEGNAELTQTLSDPERRARFSDVQFVGAVVIRDPSNRPVGVLSCSSTAGSAGFGESRWTDLKLLADELGVLIPLVR
jgi:hypothetical protein